MRLPGQAPAPREPAVNFNDRLLDFVRAAMGIPRSLPFGLQVPPIASPVLVVDHDSPPILQSKGWHAIQVAASAANFSIAGIQNVGGQGGILKVWPTVVKDAAGSVNVRCCQGVVDTYSSTGYTEVTVSSSDSRFGAPVGSGVAKIWTRNNNPAAWAPPASNVHGTVTGLATGNFCEIGPFWLDQFDCLTLEGTAINVQLVCQFRWEYYAPVR